MGFSYIALGDSLSVGAGTTFFSPGFVQRYKRIVEMKFDEKINLQMLAKPGFRIIDILHVLEKGKFEHVIEEAEIITLTVGQNDLIQEIRKFESDKNEKSFNTALNDSLENYKKIISIISKKKYEKNRPFIIRIINLYNPFPRNPVAHKWVNQVNSA